MGFWIPKSVSLGHFMMHKPPISVELYLIQYSMGWKNIAKKYYTIVVVMESGNQISVFGLKESWIKQVLLIVHQLWKIGNR